MMKLNAWPVLLAAPVLLALVTAYPHRAEILKGYREELDGPATEKSGRHIDGLGGLHRVESSKELEQAVQRMEDQAKAGNGAWSMKYSEYASQSSSGLGAGSPADSAAPIRATITGEAFEGGDAIIGVTANCRNCRMRVRKVGYGGPTTAVAASELDRSSSYSAGGSAFGQGLNSGVQKVAESDSSQSRYYSSRSEGSYLGASTGQAGATDSERMYGAARPLALSGDGSHVIKTSRVVEQTGVSGSTGNTDAFSELGSAFGSPSDSTRKEVKVTKSSWNLADLGYGTSNIEDIMRQLEEDLRTGRFENGKTITTVTTSSSVNGGAPVVHKETFVKDGFDSSLSGGQSINVGRSEIEDLMQKLKEDFRSGKTQSGKTVTTVTTTTSVNGGTPVVKKETFVKDGFDGSTLKSFGVGTEFDSSETGSAGSTSSSRKVVKTTHTRKVFTSKGGNAARAAGPIDHIGGGNLVSGVNSFASYGTSAGVNRNIGNSHETRTVDALGGGHLIREAGVPANPDLATSSPSYGGVTPSASSGSRQESSSSYHKETRRVDRLGGAHLIRDLSTGQEAANGGSLSVSQMKGFRNTAADESNGSAFGSYGGRSKYYSSFDSGSNINSGGSYGSTNFGSTGLDRVNQEQLGREHRIITSNEGTGIPASPALLAPSGVTASSGQIQRSSSSSSYKRVVQHSSSGDTQAVEQVGGYENRERDVDHLGGGHLLRDVNPQAGQTSSTIQAQTQNSQGKLEKHAGQGTSSYRLTISGSGGAHSLNSQQLEESGQQFPTVPQGGGYRSQSSVNVPDVAGNLAFINAEQGGSRIPEGGSSSYFSSHASSQHKVSSVGSGIAGVNPAAQTGTVIVPVGPVTLGSLSEQRIIGSSYGIKGSSDGGHYKSERRVDRLGEGHLIKRVDAAGESPIASGSLPGGISTGSSSNSFSRKEEWSSSGVHTIGTSSGANFDNSEEEFPVSNNPVQTSPSIKLGYGTGNGGYGGASRSGGQLSTSLLDLGISPSYGTQRQAVSGASVGAAGSSYRSSGSYGVSDNYGNGGSSGHASSTSRHYEQSSGSYGGSTGLSNLRGLGVAHGSGGSYGSSGTTSYTGSSGVLYGSGGQSSGHRSHSYSSGSGTLYQEQRFPEVQSTQDCDQSQVQQILPVRP